jgi:hypothetical protein
MRHRPFYTEDDIPLVTNKKLLNVVIKAFDVMKLYQPFGAISSLGVKESIKILNYYKKDIEKSIKEKKLEDALKTEVYIVGIDAQEKMP